MVEVRFDCRMLYDPVIRRKMGGLEMPKQLDAYLSFGPVTSGSIDNFDE